MSHTLSQIAAVVAGLALVATGLVVLPERSIKRLERAMTVSVSLALLAAALITAVRNFGS